MAKNMFLRSQCRVTCSSLSQREHLFQKLKKFFQETEEISRSQERDEDNGCWCEGKITEEV